MKALKRNFLFFAIPLFLFDVASAKIETVLGLPLSKNLNLPGTIPDAPSDEILISREQYVLSYNKERRAPNWVAWKLEANQMGASGRTNDFQTDSDLAKFLGQAHSSYLAVDPSEFSGSCYDRGHQIPSADRTDTADNNRATFLMSNMIPQTPYLNRVIWEHLEQYTRTMVTQNNKKVYVIAGPIYDKDFGKIGPKKDIPVPSKDFKIIIALDATQTFRDITKDTPIIAVIMPNTLQDGSVISDTPLSKCPPFTVGIEVRDDWKKYESTVGEIEALAGLHLFEKLPEDSVSEAVPAVPAPAPMPDVSQPELRHL